MIVRELLTRLGFKVDDAGVKKYESSYNKAMSRVSNSMGKVQAAFGGIVAQVGTVVGVNAIFNMARDWQDLSAQLVATGKASGVTLHSLDQLTGAANEVGQSTSTLTDTYMSLVRSGGLTAEHSLKLAKAIGSVAGSGAGAEGAVRQLSQSLAKGKLMWEEFQVLAENSPQLAASIQNALGFGGDRGGMMQAMTDGIITTDKLVAALDKIDQIKPPDTLNTALTVLRNNLFMAAGGSKEAGVALRYLTDAVKWLSQHMEVVTALLAVFVGGAAIGFIAWVATAVAAIGSLALAFGSLALAILANPITWIVAGLVLLALAIRDVYKWVTGGKSLIGEWLGPWTDVLAKLKAAWESFTAPFKQFWADLKTLMQAPDLASAWQALLNVLADAWSILWKATLPGMLMSLAPELFAPLKGAWDTVIGYLSSVWSEFWNGLESGITSLPGEVASSIKGAWNKFWGKESEPATGGSIPHRATGGPVSAGKAYMVGEEGPEPFIPGRSGWILPHGLGKAMAGMGGLSAPAPSSTSVRIGDIAVNIDMKMPEGTDQERGRGAATEIANHVRDELRKVFASTLSSFPETV